jgi:hypothetical protein
MFPNLSQLSAVLPALDPASNPGGVGVPEPVAEAVNRPDFGAILPKIMPAVLSAIALKQGGRQAAGAMLEGYTTQLTRQRQLEQQEEEKRLAAARDDQERRDVLTQREQQKREKAAAFLQGVAKDAAQFQDAPTLARYMELATKVGRDVFGLDEGTIRSAGVFNQSAADGKAADEAKELVASMQKMHGDKFGDLVESGATVKFRGQDTPITDLLSLANFPMRTENVDAILPFGPRGGVSPVTVGQKKVPVLPAPKEEEGGGSDFARYLKDVYAEAATKKGSPLTAGERRKIALDARKEFNQIDDPARRGPDPTTAAINALRLENMQAARNTQGLPPRVQSQVTAQASGFDRQPIVKRIQPMAEAVEFANSLDPRTTNPADDQALIYAFAKAMDPESVVREGEYATVQKYAQEWAATFRFSADRIFKSGPFLTPQARANMKRTIQDKYRAAKKQYDNVRGGFASRINKITGSVDGDSYLIDYGAGFPTLEAGQAAPPPPAAPGARGQGAGPAGPVSVGGFSVTVKKPGGGQ